MDVIKAKLGLTPRARLEDTTNDKITATVKFINAILYIFGVELVQDWRVTKRSVFGVLFFSSIWWFIFYSLYYHYPNLDIVVLAGGSALTVMVNVKFITIMMNQKRFLSLVNFVVKVYKENQSGASCQILEDAVQTNTTHCKYVLAGVFMGNGFYSFYPCYDFLFNGNLTIISPLMFPFVDHTTLQGYYISCLLNIFYASSLILLSFGFSCLFLLFVDVFAALVSIIEHDFEVLDEMVERKKQYSIEECEDAFRNILTKLMDLTRYNKLMTELFSTCATVQVFGCYYGIISVLFGYLVIAYISGVGASLFFSTELLMFCYIGQLMQNTSHRIASVIYNAKWYTYNVKMQKDLMFALALVQRMGHIRIAQVYPLNFDTGLEVVKNIYSVLMMMVNFLE